MSDRISDLETLHPQVKEMTLKLLDLAKDEGLNVDVFETYRTIERSNELHRKGTGALGGYSFHNYNLAVDIVFKDDKGWTWESDQWLKLCELGESCGFESGHRWADSAHFQCPFGLTTMQLLEGQRPPIYSKWLKWAESAGIKDVTEREAKHYNQIVKYLIKVYGLKETKE